MTNINFTIYELFIVWILIFCVNIDFVCRPKQLKSKVDRQSLKQNDVNIQRQQDRQDTKENLWDTSSSDERHTSNYIKMKCWRHKQQNQRDKKKQCVTSWYLAS